MFGETFKQALISAPISALIITIAFAAFRNSILGYFKGALSYHFSSKIEELKSELRVKEDEIKNERVERQREVDHIRSFLTDASRERSSLFLKKRVESSEAILDVCNELQRLTFLVEAAKVLDMEAVFSSSDYDKFQPVFKTIIESCQVEEVLKKVNGIKLDKHSLYLSGEALKYFTAYRNLIIHATMLFHAASAGLSIKDTINPNALKEQIVKLFPESSGDFDKHGVSYGYYWLEPLRKQLMASLRNGITGEESSENDALALLISTKNTFESAKEQLKNAGFVDGLMREDPLE